MHIPKGLACRGRDEGGYIEPLETVMAKCDWPLADWRPDAPRYRLQTEPMLVACEDLDGPIGMFGRFLDDGVFEFFLNASASSGVADFGFFGRGVWIDHAACLQRFPAALAATLSSPSSRAIQTAVFALVHKPPPSRRRFRKRARSFSSNAGFKIARAASRCAGVNRPEPRAFGVVAGDELLDPALPRTRSSTRLRRSLCPLASSQIVWKCREDVTSTLDSVTLFQRRNAQMPHDRRHVRPPRFTATKAICWTAKKESSSPS